jgi:hypothetical protein
VDTNISDWKEARLAIWEPLVQVGETNHQKDLSKIVSVWGTYTPLHCVLKLFCNFIYQSLRPDATENRFFTVSDPYSRYSIDTTPLSSICISFYNLWSPLLSLLEVRFLGEFRVPGNIPQMMTNGKWYTNASALFSFVKDNSWMTLRHIFYTRWTFRVSQVGTNSCDSWWLPVSPFVGCLLFPVYCFIPQLFLSFTFQVSSLLLSSFCSAWLGGSKTKTHVICTLGVWSGWCKFPK